MVSMVVQNKRRVKPGYMNKKYFQNEFVKTKMMITFAVP